MSATSRGDSWLSRALSITGFLVLASAAAAIAGLFYLGGFRSFLSNESSSLLIELARAQSRAHQNATILVLGNSTAAEDFRPNEFNAKSGGQIALNLGVPSGHFYLYERLLALSLQQGVRPKTIILVTTPEILSLRSDFDFLANDLVLLKTVLDSSDYARLADHTANVASYVKYAAPVLIRPALYRAELRDMMIHPRERMEEADRVRKWLASFEPGSPMQETDNRFSVCDAGPLSDLAATIARLHAEGKDSEIPDYERIRAGYAARIHQPLKVDRFEAIRFERVLRKLAAASGRVYIAAAPYLDPDFEQYPAAYRREAADTFARIASRVPGVTILPDFEADCTMMLDTVHLNRKGGEQFTEFLRSRVL